MRKVPLVRGAVAHHELLHALQVYHQGVPLTASGLKYEFWPSAIGSAEVTWPLTIPFGIKLLYDIVEISELLEE
jgi:hypothetical protein